MLPVNMESWIIIIYNLNMIIMLAFRMSSPFCSMFREWICRQLTQKVSEQKIPIFLQIGKEQAVN